MLTCISQFKALRVERSTTEANAHRARASTLEDRERGWSEVSLYLSEKLISYNINKQFATDERDTRHTCCVFKMVVFEDITYCIVTLYTY